MVRIPDQLAMSCVSLILIRENAVAEDNDCRRRSEAGYRYTDF